MIQIQNLQFSYGRNTVLRNISMSLEDGHIYGLLGENGVCKTTLLTLLAGLKKPELGTISVEGENPFKRRPSCLQDQYFLPDEVLPLNMSASAIKSPVRATCFVFMLLTSQRRPGRLRCCAP